MKKTNKNDKRSQKGRSMVEMLGVLAIVGVLSVGGVYGYGVAMKKHKANELLHQASMLATTISAQAMTNDGKLPETITSFGNTSYGTFSTTATEALDGKGFSIEISNLDGSICNQLKEGGMIRNVTCDPNAKKATITYYKNLATDPAEGEKSPTGNEGKEPEEDPCNICVSACAGSGCYLDSNDCIDSPCPYECVMDSVDDDVPCISASNCNKICDGVCYDNYNDDFEECCLTCSTTNCHKKGCPQ